MTEPSFCETEGGDEQGVCQDGGDGRFDVRHGYGAVSSGIKSYGVSASKIAMVSLGI